MSESWQIYFRMHSIKRYDPFVICLKKCIGTICGMADLEIKIIKLEKKCIRYAGGKKDMCRECYVNESRITPLLGARECLENHTQYICGTCGRCICIQRDEKRGLQRWNFPFKSLEIARLYLRTADYTVKRPCGIYEMKNSKGRVSYKIFACSEDFQDYLRKNRDKKATQAEPLFTAGRFVEYPDTEVRRLTSDEVENYLSERRQPD